MQYLLQDLFKLPLEDRLAIVEKLISSIAHTDYELELQTLLQRQILSQTNFKA